VIVILFPFESETELMSECENRKFSETQYSEHCVLEKKVFQNERKKRKKSGITSAPILLLLISSSLSSIGHAIRECIDAFV
jgi:hypothetical protein